MRDKLESIIERYNSIQDQMAESEIISNPDKLKDLAKEYKQLEPVVLTGKKYIKILDQIIDCEAMINSDDDELKELAIEELTESKNRKLDLDDIKKIETLFFIKFNDLTKTILSIGEEKNFLKEHN